MRLMNVSHRSRDLDPFLVQVALEVEAAIRPHQRRPGWHDSPEVLRLIRRDAKRVLRARLGHQATPEQIEQLDEQICAAVVAIHKRQHLSGCTHSTGRR